MGLGSAHEARAFPRARAPMHSSRLSQTQNARIQSGMHNKIIKQI